MEKIATDIYTFEELRKKGFSYIDKTAIIWSLVNESIGKQFFIARPRRFGKSLLISTLRALFEGKRELFQGLAIEPKWDWSKTWPVIHLDIFLNGLLNGRHLVWRIRKRRCPQKFLPS